MIARDFCRCFGTAGLLKVVFGAVLGCAASAALFFSEPASQPATYLDTAGWTIAEFVDHLKRNSLQFRVVPVAQDGPLISGLNSLPEVEFAQLSQRDPNPLGQKALAIHPDQ